MIRFKKVEAGEYAAVNDAGETVGHVTKTGTHLDDYPWDWHLTVERLHGRSSTGVADTLRNAKAQIRYALTGDDGMS